MDVKKSHYRCDSASDVVSDATDETLDECCRAVKGNFQTTFFNQLLSSFQKSNGKCADRYRCNRHCKLFATLI